VAYFPAQIYLGKMSPQDLVSGFFLLLLWIIFFYFLVSLVWKKGLKKYEAVGN